MRSAIHPTMKLIVMIIISLLFSKIVGATSQNKFENSNCTELNDSAAHKLLIENNVNLTGPQWCISNIEKTVCSVLKKDICQEKVACSNLTPCDVDCDTHYRCQNSGACKLRSTICNGDTCDGCPEDHEWRNGAGFKCFRDGQRCILPQQLLHDNVADCDGGADLCFIMPTLNSAKRDPSNYSKRQLDHQKCFQCLNWAMLVPVRRVCDGVVDCSDLSDECLCEEKTPSICDNVVMRMGERTNMGEMTQKLSRLMQNLRMFEGNATSSAGNRTLFWMNTSDAICPVGQVMCSNGKCLLRENICDGEKSCKEDEEGDFCKGTMRCEDATKHEYKCRCTNPSWWCSNNFGRACDGIPDCPHQYVQGNQIGSSNSFPEDECDAKCASGTFDCHPSPNYVIDPPFSLETCEGEYPDDFDPYYFNDEVCNGVEYCPLGEDEKNCPGRLYCLTKDPKVVSISNDLTCDGTLDCLDGADETERKCNDTRFPCSALGGTKVSISRDQVCDFFPTCDDGRDELDCKDGRFYCENGAVKYVLKRKTFDGRGDCSDWSDECPSDGYRPRYTFSSKYELIGNSFLRALIWIMGLLSVTGNLTVIFREGKKLKDVGESAVARSNKVLVLNLAVSDVLMGVYLIALAIAGLTMQGEYCSHDLPWRSSKSCTALGILSLISSETSVITMVLLTSCRLYAVMKPFNSARHPRKCVLFFIIASAWTASLLLALLPLVPSLSGIFVAKAEFQYNPFSRNVLMTLDGAKGLFSKLLTYDLKPNATLPGNISNWFSSASWPDLEASAAVHFSNTDFKIDRYFGYYSIQSVCIPKFFVTLSDPAWAFSFAVNLFNFVAFVFVVIAYSAIYWKSRKSAAVRSGSASNSADKDTKVMQKKILRLIITDFCCWIPICIMAFCKLGGVDIGNTAYAVAAIVLLPINSALNPMLYSDLPDLIHKKLRNLYERLKKISIRSNASKQSRQSNRDVAEQTANDRNKQAIRNAECEL